MAEFKLDRLRFTWKGEWNDATLYIKDDIVRYGGKSYVCIVGHTSSADFYTDLRYINTSIEPDTLEPKWELWFDGYEWTGAWTPTTFYNVGDMATNGAILYVCNTEHTSAETALLGIEADLEKWTSYAIAYNWLNEWQPVTKYTLNDIVKYHGNVYICTTTHTSGLATAGIDTGNWAIHSASQNWMTNWAVSTLYNINDVVRYGGIVYTCTEKHTSAATLELGLEANNSVWAVLYSGINYVGQWASAVRYRLNDVVKYGANLWICTLYHTSTSNFSTPSWAIYIPGMEFLNEWIDSAAYVPGDIVRYGGYSYYSKSHNIGQAPSVSPDEWNLLTQGFNIRGDWDSTTNYIVGDVVRHGGQIYVNIQTCSENLPTETAFWTLVIPGFGWNGIWVTNANYVIGDMVTRYASTYSCILAHTSSIGSVPVPAGNTYWKLVVTGDLTETLLSVGDTKTFSTSEMALSVGVSGQLLKVTNGLMPNWSSFGSMEYVYYVSPSGVDSPTRGVTINEPFKTVKYACDFVRAGTQNQNASFLINANRTWLVAEMYQWMLYQKANTIAPFSPSSVFSASKTKRDAGIIVEALLYDISRGGNSQIVTSTYAYFIPGTNTFFNAATTSAMPFIIASLTKLVALIQNVITNTAPAQNFQSLNNVGSPVSQTINLSYTAEAGVATTITTLSNILLNALTNVTTARIPQITSGLQATINVKTGMYSEILPIIVPADTVLIGDEIRSTVIQPASSYENLDMFLVRNGTGIRNMTLQGKVGTLGPFNAYLTKRPTGKSYVSLDPGFGPDDPSVWITTRSPYVQNVTTFGYGCIGLKIDGTLHNSGNKSVVANDFTQIISDGIGVWCIGSGSLVELVSVFSYYAHIGYLAEDGGKIRATNGNSSYGDYGTVAEGYDTTETALTGTVNNRNQNAQIMSVFAGQAQNKILALEFSNAGQGYSEAVYNFAGAGTGAIANADEFRDKSVTEVFMNGSDITAGGAGYTTFGNQAQAGDTTTITIASNDKNTMSTIGGMRVIITSGTGVGQYGYVQALDTVGKVVTVYKESTGTAGWDHIVPGTAIESILDSTTVYSIEPRVTFSAPATTMATASFGSSTVYYKPVYGNGTFVIPFTSGIKYSTNGGITWNTSTNGLAASRVVYGSGKFVAINLATATTAAYSTDGITWTSSTIPSASWNSMAAGNPNLLSYTEDFSNSYWTKSNSTITANATTAPDGTLTADKLVEDTVNTLHQTYVGIGITANTQYTYSFYVKSAERTAVTLEFGFASSPYTPRIKAVFNLSNKTATTANTGTPTLANTPTITDVGNGWFRCSVSGIFDTVSTLAALSICVANSSGFTTYTGDGTSGVYLWGAQLEAGSTATRYQPVYTTAVKQFVAVASASTTAMHSRDGITWTSTTNLPSASNWSSVTYGNGKYVTISTGTSNNAAYSTDGITWTASTLPVARNWSGVAYGNGRFVAVSSTNDNAGAYSFDGITWVQMTMPQTGWVDISYGAGKFIALSSYSVHAYSNNGIDWIYDSSSIGGFVNASNITYGNPSNVPTWIVTPSGATTSSVAIITTGIRALGRVTVGSGKIGTVKLWEPGSGYSETLTDQVKHFIGSISGTTMTVTSQPLNGALTTGLIVGGGNGKVVANTTISTINNAAVSGFISGTALTVISTISGTLSIGMFLGGIPANAMVTGSQTAAFTANFSNTTMTVTAMASGVVYVGMTITGSNIPAGTYIVSNITGAGINSQWTISTAITQSGVSVAGLRYMVDTGQTAGSGSSPLTITGVSYTVSNSQTVASNNLQAYAAGAAAVEILDPNSTSGVSTTIRLGNGVLANPSWVNRGSNYQTTTTTCTVTGNGYADMYSMSKYITVDDVMQTPSPGASLIMTNDPVTYKIINITSLGSNRYYFQIAPALSRTTKVEHGRTLEIRQLYSQVRLTGHDYLLTGTGNKETTNFPNVDTTTALSNTQVQEHNQGRVFVTATDQDGNFKVGGLFAVQQSTGIVTVSADLFNLSGLTSLTLGGVQVGQNTVTINQFSTDSYLVANSDNIVPTQKAIRSYIARILSTGGANAQTSVLTAGTVGIGPNKIFSTTNGKIVMNNKLNLKKNIDGSMLAMSLFSQSFGGYDDSNGA